MEIVMRCRQMILAVTLTLMGSLSCEAQVQIDVSKITCEQFLLFKITDPQKLAIWLNGYHHGKTGKTIVETEVLKDDYQKVKDHCYGHFQQPIMEAIEAAIKAKK